MLFDPRPKMKRKELFDREEEIELLKKLADKPLTLLLGIRRIGKSSILRVALNELGNGIYIDARKLYFDSGGWITNDVLIRTFEKSLNSLKGEFKGKIIEALKHIRGVKLFGVEIRFGREVLLSEVLEALNDVGVVIGIDEAQYLRFYGSKGGKEFLALLAYSYDNLRNVHFILTGSEVGLLHDFVGINNYESPLYGRVCEELTIVPFSRELSREFLRRGFEEVSIQISEDDIEKAVEILDGIPGWLVDFGNEYIKTQSLEKALEGVMKRAEDFLKGELKELEKRSPRYVLILKAIARGYDRWELIKDYLERNSKRVPNSRLAELLRNLEKMSWIVPELKDGRKKYKIIDPVVERVLRK